MTATGVPTIDSVAIATEKALAQADGKWEQLERNAGGAFIGGVHGYRWVTEKLGVEPVTGDLMDSLPETWARREAIDTKQRIIPLPPLAEETHVFPFITIKWDLGGTGPSPHQSIHFCFVHGRDLDDKVEFVASAIHFDSANTSAGDEPEHWRFPHVQVGNRLPPILRKRGVDGWTWPLQRLPRVPVPCENGPMQLLLTGLMSLYGTRISTWGLRYADHGVKDFAEELLARAA